MKESPENKLGVKLFPFFFCARLGLFLVVLVLNGTLRTSQAFIVAGCLVTGVAYYLWKVNVRLPGADGSDMRRISTPYVFVNKLFPILFCGGCAFLLILLMMNRALEKAPLSLAVPCAIGIGGYYIWKTNTKDLMEGVYDCGDHLLVKKDGEEDVVPLSNIGAVNFSTLRRGEQPRIHLTLDTSGKFGREIVFAPPDIFFPHRSEIAEDLLARARRARSEVAAST